MAWWTEVIGKYNMNVNMKNKIIHIGKELKVCNIRTDRKIIEIVEEFKYPGVSLDRSGSNNTDVTTRIEASTKLYHAKNN